MNQGTRTYGNSRPYFKSFGNKGQFPYGNKVVIDTASEQIYFPEYMLPPLGYQEQIDLRKGARICEILDSSLDDYVNGFISYFINDSHTMTQCLNILSLKDSVDSSLVKKITFECGTPRVMPQWDMDTSATTRHYGRSQNQAGNGSTATTPRRYASGNMFASQMNDNAARNGPVGQVNDRGYRQGNWSGDNRTYGTRGPEGLGGGTSASSPIQASTPRYKEEPHSTAPLAYEPEISIPLNSLAEGASVPNDDAHYMKVSQYRSFFIDITKLLTEAPVLGSDIMTAPQIMLIILDRKIIPLLFEIMDRIMKSGCMPEPEYILSTFNELYEPDAVSSEGVSVNKYLEKILNDVYCKNTLDFEKTQGDIRNFHFTTRLCNIPPTLSLWKNTVDEISDKDVGNLVVLLATVTRVGAISVLDEEREYRCSKCHQSVVAKAIPELHYFISVPTKCTHFISGERRQRCYGDTFIQGAAIKRTDIQEIRCQSIARGSSVAYVGGTTAVLLRRDITGTCVPGDNIHIVAFVKRRWNSLRTGKRCESHIFLDAINIEVMNLHKKPIKTPSTPLLDSMYHPFWTMYRRDEVAGRQFILQHMCSNLVSVDNAKLALLLTIIGGFPVKDETVVQEVPVNRWAKYTTDKRNNDGFAKSGGSLSDVKDYDKETKLLRTQCHILLLGCPGTGKSQFLKYAKTLVDRHVSVSGTNCTSAGLTCTIIRDGPNSMLSAGALVLADGGICCIDEFALIHPEDKACLHEAMEQQVISVAKVGIKCSLNCRCSVIAASNFKVPKGRNTFSYDDPENMYLPPEKLILNIDVPLPLLSRFDTILVFTENPLNDNELVDFLLQDMTNYRHGSSKSGTGRHNEDNETDDGSQSQRSNSQSDNCGNSETVDWTSPNALKNYVEFIRTNLFPTMNESAKNVIYAYYMAMRKQAQDLELQGGPTVRTIESLIRLSQAHARLMFRNHVTVLDTVSVIWMVELGLQGYKIGTCTGNDQVIDRQGLFPNIKELFQTYCRRHVIDDSGYAPKMGNGITSMEMYLYFEDLLMRRLNLTMVDTKDGNIGVYPAKDCEIFPDTYTNFI